MENTFSMHMETIKNFGPFFSGKGVDILGIVNGQCIYVIIIYNVFHYKFFIEDTEQMWKVFCLLKALKDQSLVICVKLLVVIPALIAHLQSSFVIHPKLTFPKTPSPRITSGIYNFR